MSTDNNARLRRLLGDAAAQPPTAAAVGAVADLLDVGLTAERDTLTDAATARRLARELE